MCGLCLPHCPTYLRDRVEGSGPRGRIALVRALESATTALTERAAQQLDECLSCLRCESVCPARVPYGHLIDAARVRWRPPDGRLRRWLWWAARPRWLAALLGLAAGWRRLGGWLPVVARRAVAGLGPPAKAGRGAGGNQPVPAVVVLPGCAGVTLERGALAAFGRLLDAGGWAWQQAAARCCGALARHAGLPAPAAALAAAHTRALDRLPAGAVALAWASGCQRQVTQDPAGERVQSALAWAARALPARLQMTLARPQRIALWAPCSLETQVGAGDALDRLVGAVDGVDRFTVRGLGCCGAAGFRHLLDAARSEPLTDAVLDEAIAARADVLVSANPGCVHALRARVRERRLSVPVLQVFEWLAGARLTLRTSLPPLDVQPAPDA